MVEEQMTPIEVGERMRFVLLKLAVTAEAKTAKTLHSLRRRGLVVRPVGTHLWRATEAGEEMVAAWDTRGSM